MKGNGGYILVDLGNVNLARNPGATPYDQAPAGTFKKLKYAYENNKPVVLTGGVFVNSPTMTSCLIPASVRLNLQDETQEIYAIDCYVSGRGRTWNVNVNDEFY